MIRRILLLFAVLLPCSAVCRAGDADKPAYDTFDAKGVKIRYSTQGEGEPVVLIHGLYASAAINWQWPGIAAALAKDHRVVAFDVPGHGGSDKPEKEEAYGAQLAEDVILLLDHLKIDKAHLVGYSMGGMIALKVVADHPDRVLSCALGGMGWMQEGGRLQQFWGQIPARQKGLAPAACAKSLGKLAISEEALKAVKTPTIVLVGDRDPVKKLYVAPLQAVAQGLAGRRNRRRRALELHHQKGVHRRTREMGR